MSPRRRAFTLIELLVVVSIIALLIAIVVPTLGSANRQAKSAVCLSQVRQIGVGLEMYTSDHDQWVIPSYTMTDVVGSTPLEGWGPILDKEGYIEAAQRTSDSAYHCPATLDIEGVAAGQTGTNPNNPKGWMDWPFLRQGTANIAMTIPERGYNKIMRVSYWINADNPIGAAAAIVPNLFYTGSVGYGPGTNNIRMPHTRASAFVRPSSLIAIADGVYAGRQRDNRIGTTNSRIGYRHLAGKEPSANAAFADGHGEVIPSSLFPRGLGGANNPAEVRSENANGKPTVYADPERALGG